MGEWRNPRVRPHWQTQFNLQCAHFRSRGITRFPKSDESRQKQSLNDWGKCVANWHAACNPDRNGILDGQSSLRDSRFPQKSRLHYHRDSDSCARYRCQHRHLFGGVCRSAKTACVSRHGEADNARRRPQAARFQRGLPILSIGEKSPRASPVCARGRRMHSRFRLGPSRRLYFRRK
jgi:hypothetical protein